MLSFQVLLHRDVVKGATPIPGLLYFTIDSYLIILNVKLGGIKYNIFSLWYDSTWDWTPVSRIIGEHPIYLDNDSGEKKKSAISFSRNCINTDENQKDKN